jgi:hypothetical protein
VEIKQERISFDGGGTWHTLVDIDEPPVVEPLSFALEMALVVVLMLIAVGFNLAFGHLRWAVIPCSIIAVSAIIYMLTKNARVRRAKRNAETMYKQYKDSLEWRTEQITIHSTIPRLLNTTRGLVQLRDDVYQSYLDCDSPNYVMYGVLAPKGAISAKKQESQLWG